MTEAEAIMLLYPPPWWVAKDEQGGVIIIDDVAMIVARATYPEVAQFIVDAVNKEAINEIRNRDQQAGGPEAVA